MSLKAKLPEGFESDAPTKPETLPDGFEPDNASNISNLNEPTSASPSEMEKLANAAVDSTPGISQIKTMGTKVTGRVPGFRIPFTQKQVPPIDFSTTPARAMVEGAATGLGSEVGGLPGAGVGNAVGGKIMDLAEDPNTVIRAVNSIFGNGSPLGQQLLDAYKQNPDQTIQAAKDELVKAGYRFSSGMVAQLFSNIVGKGIELGAKGLSALGEGLNFDRPDVQIPGAQASIEAQGMSADPSQYSTSKVAQEMKTLADRGMLSGDKLKAISNKNTAIISKNLSDLTTEMAGNLTEDIPSTDLAKMIVAPKQKLGEPLQDAVSKQLYSNLSDVISGEKQTFYRSDANSSQLVPVVMRPGGNPVSLQGMKAVGQEMEKTTLGKLQSSFADNIQGALQGLREAPDTTDFETAHDIRSKLLYAVRNSGNDTLIGLAKRASAAVDQSMEEAVTNSGKPYANDMWRGTDSFFRAGKETFNNDLTAKLMITQPGQATAIGRQFVRHGSLEMAQQLDKVAQRVEDLVTNPVNNEQLQQLIAKNPDVLPLIEKGDFTRNSIMNMYRKGYLQELSNGATKVDPTSPTGYRLDFNSMRSDIDPKINPENAATFNHLFPGETGNQYKRALEAGDLAFKRNPEQFDRALYYINKLVIGTPVAAVTGALGAGLGAITGHPILGGSAGMLAGEAIGFMAEGPISAAILTNPEARSLWLQGAKMLQNSNGKIAKAGVDTLIKAAKTVTDQYVNSR